MSWMKSSRDAQGAALAGVILSALVAVGALAGKLSWMALVVVVVLAAGYLLGARFPVSALAALLACVAVERAEFSLLRSGAITVRLDEILGPAIAVGLITRAARSSTLRARLRRIPGLLPLGLFVLLNLAVTVITAETVSRGNLARGFNLVVILIAAALCYVAVCLAVMAVRDARQITFPLLLTAGVEAAIGIIALILSVALSQRLFGVQTDMGTMQTEPYGTMYEANFFGDYTAAMTALALALAVGLARQLRWRWRNGLALLALAAVTFTAMLLSLTRTAWLALALGVVAMAALSGAVTLARRRGAASRHAQGSQVPSSPVQSLALPSREQWTLGLTALSVMVVGFGIAFAREIGDSTSAKIVSSLGRRIGTTLDLSSGSGYGRVLILKLVLADWRRSPLLGLGMGSFNVRLPGQTEQPWIYSMLLAILHDSGLIGLALIVWFLFAIGRSLWQGLRAAESPSARWLTIGIAGAAIVMLVGAQATSSFNLMLLWVFLGLAAAVPSLLVPGAGDQATEGQLARADSSSPRFRGDPVGVGGRQ